jgi:hypothetical protein
MNPPSIPEEAAGKVANRLTVLLGLAGLLKDGAFGALSDRQKHALEELLETSEELRVLLRPLFPQRPPAPTSRTR